MMRTCTGAAVAASLCLAASMSPLDASAQLAKGIVGAWTLSTNVTTDASGKKEETYGHSPMGQVVFSADGRYTLLISRPDVPKVASNNRLKGTPEENKAVVAGTLAHYGKYSVNEKDKMLTFQILASTYPNWNGTEQKRPATLAGDELRWSTANASGGGNAELVWKRAK